jgi:hypothetical protein
MTLWICVGAAEANRLPMLCYHCHQVHQPTSSTKTAEFSAGKLMKKRFFAQIFESKKNYPPVRTDVQKNGLRHLMESFQNLPVYVPSAFLVSVDGFKLGQRLISTSS